MRRTDSQDMSTDPPRKVAFGDHHLFTSLFSPTRQDVLWLGTQYFYFSGVSADEGVERSL